MDESRRPDETGFRFIGKPLPRKEDARLITGHGRFTDDFAVEGQAYAAIVRSPHPHARIAAIITERAKAMPGVLGVFTGADCAADKIGPIPHDPVPKTKYDMKLHGPGGKAVFAGPHMLLPADKVRHVGEAVVMVVAETKAQAMDAAEAVEVQYEELPFVLHSEGAMQPGAPTIWDQVPDNITVETFFGDREATDRAFARAAHVVTKKFHIGRVTGVPMEPRSALGQYDAATDSYLLYAGSGGAVRQRNELIHVVGVPPERLRVISADVGGNFGTRNRTYVEFGLVLWAAKKLGRPVKYTAMRSEAFLSDYQGRDLVTTVELAIDDKHRFIGMRATNISNVGARCVSLSPLSKGSGLIPGSYAIPATTLRSVAVFTNTMPTNAYRSSGRPEVTFAIERLVDEAAKQLGVDRIALRRKNLISSKAMPYRNSVGMLYDSGHYEENMDWAMEIADWKGFPARRREAKRRGKLLGRGLANYVEFVDRSAEGAGAAQGAAARFVRAGPRRCRDRHAIERAGPRDELRPGGGRSASRSRRAREHHLRRYRGGESRWRVAFGTLDAPCRHGFLQGCDRSHRQRQGDCGNRDGLDAGKCRLRRRPISARATPI